jgi:hypothetical protein
MPRGDRTGPLGEGPMTGRQLGYGAGYNSPGYARGSGMGLGRGFFGRGRGFFGFGRGYRYFWRENPANYDLPAEASQSDELNFIKSTVQDLKNTLAAISDRLNRLDPGDKDK